MTSCSKMVKASELDQPTCEAGLRRETFRQLLSAGQLTSELAGHLAHAAAADFMAYRQTDPHGWKETITLLCEMATLADPAISALGVQTLFSRIVEPLADSFEPQDCVTYCVVFAHVIQFCRRLPEGRVLDDQLHQFGLRGERDFLERMRRITKRRTFDPAQIERVKKALVLSRVTLGADVEITSVIWQKLRQRFPAAEVVLLANEKAYELFGGDPTFRLHPLRYHRSGRLIERLSSWLAVVSAVQQECRGLHSDEFLIVDPDSRLTQLGLLPVVSDETSYWFFESRSYQRAGLPKLSQLAAQWMDDVFGPTEPVYPQVRLRPEDRAFAEAIVGPLRQHGAQRVISLNFGVGENPNKRVPDPFEPQLVLSLLQPGTVVILDKGNGTEEVRRADAIAQIVRQCGKRVVDLTADTAPRVLDSGGLLADVITWHGGIGRFSALVAHTDYYIGYDSAGQHIAVALGIPTTVIFAGYPSPRFVERWTPAGPGVVRVVQVGAQPPTSQAEVDHLIRQVIKNVECGELSPLG